MLKRLKNKLQVLFCKIKTKYFESCHSNFYNFSKNELTRLVKFIKEFNSDENDYKMEKRLSKATLKYIKELERYSKYGGSIKIALRNLNNLYKDIPILPITGNGIEWEEKCRHNDFETLHITILYRNKRYPKLYKFIVIDSATGEVIKTSYVNEMKGYDSIDIHFPYMPGID